MSQAPVPVGLSVDRIADPVRVIETRLSGPVVVCGDETLMPLAALVAMRSGAVLVDEAPWAGAHQVIAVGKVMQADQRQKTGAVVELRDAEQTLAFLNARAARKAVLVFKGGTLVPEHVLYAFRRGVLLVEVEPPPYSGDDVGSEVVATRPLEDPMAVSNLRSSRNPEAFVIAATGRRFRTASRVRRRHLVACPDCENGTRTFSPMPSTPTSTATAGESPRWRAGAS